MGILYCVAISTKERTFFGYCMDDVRDGKISCIIVKDMSRFGRDYIEASNYIETIFPFLGVRFISVSDHFDTEAEYNQNKALEIALKNLVNDMYAKDISKRVSVSRRLDMERGKFTGSNAPYGYKVDSGDVLRKYVIDRDAAAVVRQIFELAADGVTLREIAKALQEYRLALPGDYLKTGNLYVEEGAEAKAWYPGTISNILKNQAYIGNMVQGKRRTSLYDNEARHATDENDWIVVENTHEAIVDKELFNKVRAVMYKKVEESIFTSDRGKNLPIKEDIFAGILFCGNCGRRIPLASRILEKDGVLERQYFYSCRYNYDFGGKGSALAGALILLITWKIAYKIFGWIWRERNVDTGVIEYNIELSDGERQWCNSISIGGMIVIGIILFAQTGEEDYFEVISMAFSIWMGSYISIQKVQQKNTIKEVLRDWKTVFEVRSKLVPITGTIFMFVLVCFIALNYFEQARMIFDEMIIGFAIGSISFLLGIVIKNKYQKNSRFEAKK